MKSYPTKLQTEVALATLLAQVTAEHENDGSVAAAVEFLEFTSSMRKNADFEYVLASFVASMEFAARTLGARGIRPALLTIFSTGIRVGFLAGQVPAEIIPAIEQSVQSGIAY